VKPGVKKDIKDVPTP